jgi:hypothetical protein
MAIVCDILKEDIVQRWLEGADLASLQLWLTDMLHP